MTKTSTAAPALLRRTVIGAATAAPILGAAPLAPNDTVAQCADWIALDREIDRLTLRWSKLETLLVREHGWFGLTLAAQRALPEAAELIEIDERLEALSQRRDGLLKPLSSLSADTLHAVASKLVIAARLLRHEDHPAQLFVAGAVGEMAEMSCPGCGAAYVPARVNTRR